MAALTSQFSDEFFSKLKSIARARNFRPEDALLVFYAESGLKPSAIHPTAPASGLFGKYFSSRAEALAFAAQPPEQQLDAYDAFLAPYTSVSKDAPETLYQINFLPGSLKRGTSEDTVLAAQDGTGYGGQEGSFYAGNRILDYDGNGEITVGDLRQYLAALRAKNPQLWAELNQRLATSPGEWSPRPAGTSGLVWLLVLGGLGVAGYAYYRSRGGAPLLSAIRTTRRFA